MSLIVVHNHPSGDCTPSDADLAITDKLIKAAEIMGINIDDHLIVSEEGFYSFNQEGFIKKPV